MITTKAMANAAGDNVEIEIVSRTVLNGAGIVEPGSVHIVPAAAARLLLSIGKAKPAPVKTTRKSKAKPD
jgi:hypothetical protein